MVTANAASVGDLLLGVPLLCSSGLPMDAAAVLQEAGLWRYAATLAAQLPPSAAAAALDNWAHHMQQACPRYAATPNSTPAQAPAHLRVNAHERRRQKTSDLPEHIKSVSNATSTLIKDPIIYLHGRQISR